MRKKELITIVILVSSSFISSLFKVNKAVGYDDPNMSSPAKAAASRDIPDLAIGNQSHINTIASTDQTPAQPVDQAPRAPYRFVGINTAWYSNPSDQDFTAQATQILDRATAVHANAVALNLAYYTLDYNDVNPQFPYYETGSMSFKDRGLSPQHIAQFISMAHERRLTVMLRPLMAEEWQITAPNGTIQYYGPNASKHWKGNAMMDEPPANIQRWFANYWLNVMRPITMLAVQNGAESVSISSENAYLEYFGDQWIGIINQMRANGFKGLTALSINWDDTLKDYMQQPYVQLIGIDWYFELKNLVPSNATEQQLEFGLAKIAEKVKAMNVTDRGVYFVLQEWGIGSQNHAYLVPWEWNPGTGINLNDQANYIEAMCNVVVRQNVTPNGEFYWIFNYHDRSYNPISDGSFDVMGKPGEAMLAACVPATG